MSGLRRTLRKVKKYSGMVSMAATAGIIITTVIMKLRNKE